MEARWGGKVEITKKTNNAGQVSYFFKYYKSCLYCFFLVFPNEISVKSKNELIRAWIHISWARWSHLCFVHSITQRFCDPLLVKWTPAIFLQ